MPRRAPSRWLACLLIATGPSLAASAPAQTPPPLRLLASEAWAMPLAQLQRSRGVLQLSDGVLLHWGEALARELGRPVSWVLRPRKRIESSLLDDAADLYCLLHPDWLSAEGRGRMQWPAQPFMQIEERLVAAPGQPLPAMLADLDGQTLGTVLGYHYPLLDPGFASGRHFRDDAPNEALLARKLLQGKNRYGVMRSLDLDWINRGQPAPARLQASDIVLTSKPVFCVLAPAARLALPDFEQAQQKLLKRGVLQQILERYR